MLTFYYKLRRLEVCELWLHLATSLSDAFILSRSHQSDAFTGFVVAGSENGKPVVDILLTDGRRRHRRKRWQLCEAGVYLQRHGVRISTAAAQVEDDL